MISQQMSEWNWAVRAKPISCLNVRRTNISPPISWRVPWRVPIPVLMLLPLYWFWASFITVYRLLPVPCTTRPRMLHCILLSHPPNEIGKQSLRVTRTKRPSVLVLSLLWSLVLSMSSPPCTEMAFPPIPSPRAPISVRSLLLQPLPLWLIVMLKVFTIIPSQFS